MIVFQFLPQVEVMRSSLTAFPNARKGIEKMTHSVIFIMKFKLCGKCAKTLSRVDRSSQF